MHYKTASADGLLMLFLENFCSLRVTGAVYHTHHRESLFLLSSVFPMLLKAIQRRTTVFISVHKLSEEEQVFGGYFCQFCFAFVIAVVIASF